MFFPKITIFLLYLALFSCSLIAQEVKEPQNTPPEWSRQYEPFRIVGNLYYVGTEDLACYLITTKSGHVLINTGLAASAALIRSNVETLGFKFSDIKILLTTQAHYDHMGAMAAIKAQTETKMMANAKDADVMADGGKSDYAFGGASTYQPVTADRLLRDRDTVKLGEMNIVMLHHPGHTKGSSSFLFDIKDELKTYKVLIANMPTIVTPKSFAEVFGYPEIAKDYAYTINAMKNLSFDIWLSSHASQFGLHKKHKPGDAYNPAAFIDKSGYDVAISGLQKEYAKKMASK